MRISTRHLTAPVALAAALLVAGCNMLGSDGAGDLTGQAWEWTASTTVAPASQSVVPDPERYTIQFMDDGTFSAKADCNQVNGQYAAPGGGALTITLGASTMAACPEDSLADLFVAGLDATTSYIIEGGQLVLTTADGTMTFG